jgi:hypothetical protein
LPRLKIPPQLEYFPRKKKSGGKDHRYIYNRRGYSIYQLLFTHGPHVTLTFFKIKKVWEEVQTVYIFFYSGMDASYPEIYLLYTAIFSAAPQETVEEARIEPETAALQSGETHVALNN